MTHEQAEEQHAAERYLLGELHGPGREEFEEHLFACPRCAADLQDGMLLLRSAQQELARKDRSPVVIRSRGRRWGLMALAAGLLIVIGYQNLVQVPELHQQLARAEAPSVLRELVLAGAGTRGGLAPTKVRLPRDGSLLLAVDIPGSASYEKYICALWSPQGKLLWKIEIAPHEVENAVPLRVPAQHLNEGENILRVQGFAWHAAGESSPPADLATYRFDIVFNR